MRGSWALHLLALLLPAAAARAQAPSPPAGPAKRVHAIRFEGNRRYTDKFLKEQIATKEGEEFDPGLLDRDERLLREYFSAVLDVEVQETEAGVDLTFHVLDRVIAGKVEFRGLRRVSKKDFEALLSTRPGRPIHEFALKSDVDLIERLHREKGYHFVDVKYYRRRTAKPDVEDIVFQVITGEPVRVLEVLLEGAHSVDRDELLKLARNSDRYRHTFLGLGKLFNPSYFDRNALEEDRARMELYYHREGWLDAKVVLVGFRFDENQEFSTIHFRIEEGPRYTVRSFRVEYEEGGEPEEADREFLAPRALENLSQLDPLGPYRAEDFDVTVRRVQERLYSRFYSTARLTNELIPYPEDHTVDLKLRIHAGPKVRLGRIKIFGNRYTRDNVIRRAFREGALPGGYLDFEAVEAGLVRLRRTRYFSFVGLAGQNRGLVKSPNPERQDEYDLEIELEETDTRQIQFGAGVSTDGGAFGNFSITWNNFDIKKPPDRFWGLLDRNAFRGGGQTFTLSASPGTTFSTFAVAFADPAVRDSPWSFSFSVSRRIALFDDYDQTVDEIRITVGRDLDLRRRWRATFGWTLRQVILDDPDPAAPVNALDAQGSNAEQGLDLTLRRARRREADFFLNGYITTLRFEVIGGPLGADVDVWKISIDQAAGWRVLEQEKGGWHRLRVNFRAAWAESFDDTVAVPIFERSFLGGRSLRGFEFREVGPRSNDRPTGGDFLVTLSTQYTVPLTPPDATGFGIDLLFFVDQGGLSDDFGAWEAEDWRISAGFGIGISFGRGPQPPLQIDFGWPIRQRAGDRRQVVSIAFERNF